MKRVIFLIFSLVPALTPLAAQTTGLWDYETSHDLYAGTTNDSSNTFGQHCSTSDGRCKYFVGLPSSCKDGISTPALVNSDRGAFNARLVCVGRAGKYNLYRYVFENFDDVDSTVRNSTRIGVAIPMEGGEVTVLRFSLDGAIASITIMRSAADKRAGTSR